MPTIASRLRSPPCSTISCAMRSSAARIVVGVEDDGPLSHRRTAAAPAAIPHSSALPERGAPAGEQPCPARREVRLAGADRVEHARGGLRQLAALGAAQVLAAERRAALRRQRDRVALRPAPGGVAREHVVARGRQTVAATGELRYGAGEVARRQGLEAGGERGRRRRDDVERCRERRPPARRERARQRQRASRRRHPARSAAPRPRARRRTPPPGSPGTRSPRASPATRIDSGPSGERAGASRTRRSSSRT